MMVNATFANKKLRVVLIWKQIRYLPYLTPDLLLTLYIFVTRLPGANFLQIYFFVQLVLSGK